MSDGYSKPEIKTLSVGEILEILGPVSCGSGQLGGDAILKPTNTPTPSNTGTWN